MSGRRPYRRWLKVMVLLVFTLSISCRVVSLAPVEEALEGAGLTRVDEGDYRTPKYLGFVDDPAGQPVGFALAGGTEISTREGVVSGDFEGFAGRWMPVDSMGYATGFAFLSNPGDEFPFFNATLTPFQSLVYLEQGSQFQLAASRDGFRVTAEVSRDMFPSSQVFVGLTAVAPLHIDPRYADTELENGLRVQGAFAFQAFDQQWHPVTLEEGQTVEVQIELDQDLSPASVWAVFDPEAGIWREADPACTRLESAAFTCRLADLQPLVAVFDVPPHNGSALQSGAPGLKAGGFTLGTLFSTQAGFQSGTDSGSGGVDGAIDQIADWLKQQEEQGGGVDPDDPTLKNLIDQLIEKALEEAGNNRTEQGKKALVTALQVVIAAGQPGSGAPLEAEMAEISNEIGEKALQESDCGEFRKLLKAAEQIELMGGSMDLHRQLTEKAGEMADDCDIWVGWITVSLWATADHPSGLPMVGGGGSWNERHDVQIWTNVDDYVMHGESNINYSFSTVTYETEKECKSTIKFSGSPGQTRIVYKGFYDGYTFQINSVTPEGGATINQHWIMRSKQDDQCQVDLDRTFSLSPYYSLIVHGTSSDSPPIDFQEILESSISTSTFEANDSLSGTEHLNNPDPDLGLYPFRKGFVTWNLIHRQKKLPLEEEGAGQ